MIPEIERIKEEIKNFGTSGVREIKDWCSAFLQGYNYAKENEKGCDGGPEKGV